MDDEGPGGPRESAWRQAGPAGLEVAWRYVTGAVFLTAGASLAGYGGLAMAAAPSGADAVFRGPLLFALAGFLLALLGFITIVAEMERGGRSGRRPRAR